MPTGCCQITVDNAFLKDPIVVTGAGDTQFNRGYSPTGGSINGRPVYRNQDDWPPKSYDIYWNGGTWAIREYDLGLGGWQPDAYNATTDQATRLQQVG